MVVETLRKQWARVLKLDEEIRDIKHRLLAGLEAAHPQVTTVLEFDPGEAAQVDFGKGPEVLDPRTGELLSTWVFVMTLAWSRHAYAEVVTDQKVATWLGCRCSSSMTSD